MSALPEFLRPYERSVAVCGVDCPQANRIEDLIRLLVTIHHRWGNTAVQFRIQWGSDALWAESDLLTRLVAIREKLQAIVVTEGVDKGVVLLSWDSPTHWDEEVKCQVYDHENFSPLGDALIELYELTGPKP